MFIVLKLVQYIKALFPIVTIESESITVSKFLHEEKAYIPIEVTELGIVIEVKLLQYRKASTPIVVTEFGIIMLSAILDLIDMKNQRGWAKNTTQLIIMPILH